MWHTQLCSVHKLFLSSTVREEKLQTAVEVKLQKGGKNNWQRMKVKDKRRTKEARKVQEWERRNQKFLLSSQQKTVLFVLA